MSGNKRVKGNIGEELACCYLKSKGYKIIERNFHCRIGEIDIIAKDSDVLVFVEVKTRTSKAFGSPQESITRKKLSSIIKTAHYYKLKNPKLPSDLRIDLVAITQIPQEETKIELIKNITS